jgi:DNA-binding response OmpR family regulator
MKLLVVEDNRRLSRVMGNLLRENGMVADIVETLAEANAAMAVADYDLVLLDLALPDGDGSVFLRAMRARRQATPVLVATASGDVADRVRVLNLGADDYLIKPFSLDELLARIRAVLRRPAATAPTVLHAGNIAFDQQAQTCRIGDVAVELPRMELLVLASLMANPGRLMPKARLEQAIYSMDEPVTPNALEAVVSRLRKRLDVNGATVTISVMRGLGYYLQDRTQ